MISILLNFTVTPLFTYVHHNWRHPDENFVTVKPRIDEDVSQSPTVENGIITVKVGSPVFVVYGFKVSIICDVASGVPPMTFSWF